MQWWWFADFGKTGCCFLDTQSCRDRSSPGGVHRRRPAALHGFRRAPGADQAIGSAASARRVKGIPELGQMTDFPASAPRRVRSSRAPRDRPTGVPCALGACLAPAALRAARDLLSASIGSSDAARIAGYSPKNSPTIAVIEMPSTTDHGSTTAGSGLTWLMTQATRKPSAGADDAAEHRERDRLGEDLPQDVAPPRAERLAQPDLARALAHRHQHDVHDDDAADDEREADDADQDGENRRTSPGCRC